MFLVDNSLIDSGLEHVIYFVLVYICVSNDCL